MGIHDKIYPIYVKICSEPEQWTIGTQKYERMVSEYGVRYGIGISGLTMPLRSPKLSSLNTGSKVKRRLRIYKD